MFYGTIMHVSLLLVTSGLVAIVLAEGSMYTSHGVRSDLAGGGGEEL
jgi:hypothetical protein